MTATHSNKSIGVHCERGDCFKCNNMQCNHKCHKYLDEFFANRRKKVKLNNKPKTIELFDRKHNAFKIVSDNRKATYVKPKKVKKVERVVKHTGKHSPARLGNPVVDPEWLILWESHQKERKLK